MDIGQLVKDHSPLVATMASMATVALNKKLGLDLTDAQVMTIGAVLVGFLGHHHMATRAAG